MRGDEHVEVPIPVDVAEGDLEARQLERDRGTGRLEATAAVSEQDDHPAAGLPFRVQFALPTDDDVQIPVVVAVADLGSTGVRSDAVRRAQSGPEGDPGGQGRGTARTGHGDG